MSELLDIPVLETERLRLRGFHASDIDAYAEVLGHAEVMRHMGGPVGREDTWWSIASLLGHWALRGYGVWAVEDKASRAFLGRLGLLRPEAWPALEIAWMLARPHWGKGYATEGARAVKDWAVRHLPAQPIVSLVLPENERSAAVARRLGAEPDGFHVLSGQRVIVFRHPVP